MTCLPLRCGRCVLHVRFTIGRGAACDGYIDVDLGCGSHRLLMDDLTCGDVARAVEAREQVRRACDDAMADATWRLSIAPGRVVAEPGPHDGNPTATRPRPWPGRMWRR